MNSFTLILDGIMRQMHAPLATLTEPRMGKNMSCTMVDAALIVFTVFFTHSPLFRGCQRRRERTHGHHHARLLFGVHAMTHCHYTPRG